MPRLNLQKLRQEYSCIPVLAHHVNILPHGKAITSPQTRFKKQKRRYPTYDKKV